MNITVYGAASEDIKEGYKTACEKLGEELAKRGHTLIFGGGKNGLMGAVARGAKKYDGEIIGIAPKFFKPDGVLYEECTEFIYTDDMRSRKALLESKSDAIIMLPGGIGTFDEFFEVFTLNTLGQINKPIAVFNTLSYYRYLKEMLLFTAEEGFMKKEKLDGLFISEDVKEIFRFLEKGDIVRE
ncbi:MAG: TIGR00730 family Rossman fold protein [Acutalibacteraceae bacterium]|nr:TIGR00730 family Rossman fold protein [Acutalibacteraceae bacterium]